MKKVSIVGTGWYGCHAAMVLDKLGIDYDMVDKSNGFMVESSTKNQNRLHLHECTHSYREFCQTHPEYMIDVPKNRYLVAKDSMIDFQTYANIFAYGKTPFDIIIQSSELAGMPFPWLDDRFDGFMLIAWSIRHPAHDSHNHVALYLGFVSLWLRTIQLRYRCSEERGSTRAMRRPHTIWWSVRLTIGCRRYSSTSRITAPRATYRPRA